MDKESWTIAQVVAKVAMIKRENKIKCDTEAVKKWRRSHCRKCNWCKGCSNNENLKGSMCNGPTLDSQLPFLFILVCSESSTYLHEQNKIAEMAKSCGSYIELKKMDIDQLNSFIKFSFGLLEIPQELSQYLIKVSAGLPKLAFLTTQMLIDTKALAIQESEEIQNKSPNCSPHLNSIENHINPQGLHNSFESYDKQFLDISNKSFSHLLKNFSCQFANFNEDTWELDLELKENRYLKATILKDLESCQFIPEVIAHNMFIIERLKPDEQQIAKVATIYQENFTIEQLFSIIPKPPLLGKFMAIISSLVKKDVFEINQTKKNDLFKLSSNPELLEMDNLHSLPQEILTLEFKFNSLSLKVVFSDLLLSEERQVLKNASENLKRTIT